MYPRIAFVGFMGSGKSDHSKYLAQSFGLTHISIAEPIKAIGRKLAPLLGIDPDDKAAMRPILQAIGEGPREHDPDFWVRAMVQKYDLTDSVQGVGYVVDDCRYPNEGLFLQRVGFEVIRLEASETTRKSRIEKRDGKVDDRVFDHQTETAIAHVIHDRLLPNETEDDLTRNFVILAAEMIAQLPKATASTDDSYVGEAE